MTPLGLNTAAVPEAAALFPLSAAIPPAAERSSSTGDAASTSFGDLLAASFAPSEPPVQAAAGDNAGAAFNTLSLADIWFAGLNVDLGTLNASLEAEETGTSTEATAVTGVPADDGDATDAVDDENAALMAFAMSMSVPDAWPEGHALQVLDNAAACSAHPSGCAGDSYVGQALSDVPVAGGEVASSNMALADHLRPVTAPHRAGATGTPPEGAPSGPEELAPHADDRKGSTEQTPVEVAPQSSAVAASRVAAVPASITETPATGAQRTELPIASTSDVGRATAPHRGGAMGTPPEGPPGEPAGLAPHADVVSVEPTPAESSSVEEQTTEPVGKVIDAAPPVQQAGRTRETVAAKLAEMTGLGQSGEAASKPAPGTNLAGDSQAQTQDGSAQDACVAGVPENAAAARSSDTAAATPVFVVAPPVESAARPLAVAPAVLPQAPAAQAGPAPENVGRLIESMRVQMRDGIQEATVRLKPEHMGEVTISIRVERGAVSAVVHTETPAVQQWLESQEGKLRTGLSEQGLHLERFMVHRDGTPQHREQQRQQQPVPRYRQQRDDSAIRFEVLV